MATEDEEPEGCDSAISILGLPAVQSDEPGDDDALITLHVGECDEESSDSSQLPPAKLTIAFHNEDSGASLSSNQSSQKFDVSSSQEFLASLSSPHKIEISANNDHCQQLEVYNEEAVSEIHRQRRLDSRTNKGTSINSIRLENCLDSQLSSGPSDLCNTDAMAVCKIEMNSFPSRLSSGDGGEDSDVFTHGNDSENFNSSRADILNSDVMCYRVSDVAGITAVDEELCNSVVLSSAGQSAEEDSGALKNLVVLNNHFCRICQVSA